MNRLGYITNTSLSESSGGGSGVNYATYTQLGKAFEIAKPVIIIPKRDNVSKLKSVILKKLGLKRNYHAFSEARLLDVKNQFETYQNNAKDLDCYFFHGFTQWIKTEPNKPYFCFNDACFATYVDIYNNFNEFSGKDLHRIFNEERQWLEKAKKVFFRSKWALEETKKAYQTEGNNFVNVGVGGFIDIPAKDKYQNGFNFLFISREFIPKGGYVVVEAIQKLRIKYNDVNLWIVGERPRQEIESLEGVHYLGFFNKSNPNEKIALVEIFEKAFALVHPTLKDTNTLVINELAYYGCPAISSRKFAIPEYLLDGITGYLVNNPRDSEELTSVMEKLMNNSNDNKYLKMRESARKNAITHNTWPNVGDRLVSSMKSEL